MARFAQQTKAVHRRRCECGRWRDYRAKGCSTCRILSNVEPKLAIVTDIEWQEFSAWLAGEGHARYQKRRADISIANIDREIMDWLQTTFGGRVAFRSGPKRSPIYEWTLGGIINLRRVFTQLIPITHHGKRHHYQTLLDSMNADLAIRGV